MTKMSLSITKTTGRTTAGKNHKNYGNHKHANNKIGYYDGVKDR